MTRRDYVQLAWALGSSVDLDEATSKVSAVCLDDNPNFDPDRFRQAVIDERVKGLCA